MSVRLYQELAQKLVHELSDGKYPVGARLPAERELAQRYGVSRPTVREATIALEVRGLVEVRIGSGTYVVRLPEEDLPQSFDVSAIELTEARLLFESEAAALAAQQITDAELTEIEELVTEIARENRDPAGTERADRLFHLAIGRATRNKAVQEAIERLWNMRSNSAEAALLHEKARTANVKPVVEEHTAIVDALRRRDPAAAREAMHKHLSAVIDSLLFATEGGTQAAEDDQADVRRQRYQRAAR